MIMNVAKLKNVQNIISVEETDYEVKTEIQRGWFSNKKCQKETKVFASKVLFHNGKPLKGESLSFSDGTLLKNRTVTNYSSGILLNETIYDGNGKVLSTRENEIVCGMVRRSVCRENSYDGVRVTTTEYDSHDHRTLYLSVDYHTYEQNYEWTYSRNFEGAVHTCKNKVKNEREEYYYNGKGQLVKYQMYKNGVLINTTLHFYNMLGQEISTSINGWEEQIKYDQYGNEIWQKWYPELRWWNGDDKFPTSPIEAISEFSYVYDEFGNWTEFRQYRNGKYNRLRLRKILYK